jgi:hypothetical protein
MFSDFLCALNRVVVIGASPSFKRDEGGISMYENSLIFVMFNHEHDILYGI